jgi:hypothetical protein
MKKYLEKPLTELPQESITDNNLIRYGFLAIIVALFAASILLLITLPASYHSDRYSSLIIGLMLLLNHLAFQFRWPKAMTIVIRVIATLWVLFGFFYMFYLSDVLFPRT